MADDWLGRLNSATKYPPIETYHAINPENGRLLDQGTTHYWEGRVLLTEKVDGTNGRVVVMPDGDWFIGSREELLYARGDRIENPNLGIVPALLPLAPTLTGADYRSNDLHARVYFLEVYGYRVGPAAKQYTRDGQRVGYRLFDVAEVPLSVLAMARSEIAGWRDAGNRQFLAEGPLAGAARDLVDLVPRLGVVNAAELPTALAGTQEFLKAYLHRTQVALDDTAGGKPEGIVLRTADRSLIAKARFQDYERSLAPEQPRKGKQRG